MFYSLCYQSLASGIIVSSKDIIYVNNMDLEIINSNYNTEILKKTIDVDFSQIDFNIETQNIVVNNEWN